MMMINSPSNGGVSVNCRNSRVTSKVKIPLKNKVNTTNRFCPRCSFSAVMKESVQRCRFITYTARAAGAACAEQLLCVYTYTSDVVHARRQCLAHLSATRKTLIVYSDCQDCGGGRKLRTCMQLSALVLAKSH